jgi:2-succinyl-5-enolpyruvyl-6-hydroxy-3-cyclohexene-1-carboxylate synthase
VNPSTALAAVLADELIRCGLREAVLAPGSRSAPLALALHARAEAGGVRLHVRIDERSASFLALGLAKASRRPVALVCTSGTAAAHFHAAVIEADEAGVPLIVLTADRPPELRGTGASQTIDQLKLYGSAVRWFCELGVPEALPGMAGYWRSLTCRAWGQAAGLGGGHGVPGPVHLNVPLRDPLVPDDGEPAAALTASSGGWPESLDGRPGNRPWTSFADPAAGPGWPAIELPWAERGLIICGDGDYDAEPLLRLAGQAGWPVLAEPSSNARRGPNALPAYAYLLADPGFAAAHRPDVIVSAGRPGLSRGQLACLRGAPGEPPRRHVVLAAGPGRWSDPARTATDVAGSVRLAPGPAGDPAGSAWLAAWRAADAAARAASDEVLAVARPLPDSLSEPLLARTLAAALPDGGLLWAASSLPVRDLDQHMRPRSVLRVLASRGASGIDGLISAAIGAACAHQADGGGPAAALLGDLAFLHDAAGLFIGPDEPRPDLCLVVANNDGGGIFSLLEQAALPVPFERVFGTPHGADLSSLAAAAGIGYHRLERAADLPALLGGPAQGAGAQLARIERARSQYARSQYARSQYARSRGGRAGGAAGDRGGGLRIIEARTDRAEGTELRKKISAACAAALAGLR